MRGSIPFHSHLNPDSNPKIAGTEEPAIFLRLSSCRHNCAFHTGGSSYSESLNMASKANQNWDLHALLFEPCQDDIYCAQG
jgi:hypothetical protein